MDKTTALPVFDTTAPYNIKREYYKTGFECFQKKFILKRNWIMLVLFFILFVSFVASAVANPSNKTAYFLMMICLAGMFVLWYNPRKQKRMVLDAVRELEFEQFTDEKKMFYILPKSALASPAAELPEEASAESGADSEA